MRKGFTLIELLAVVMIVGVLSAVALPYYRKAVEHSRAAEPIAVWDHFRKMAMPEMSAGILKGVTHDDMSICAPWLQEMGLSKINDIRFRSDNFLYQIRDCTEKNVTLEICRSQDATSYPCNGNTLYALTAGLEKTGFNIRTSDLRCLAEEFEGACSWFNN